MKLEPVRPARELLVEQIKGVGQDLINHADNIIPDSLGAITSLNISIDFPIPSNSGTPEISYQFSTMSTTYIDSVFTADFHSEVHPVSLEKDSDS